MKDLDRIVTRLQRELDEKDRIRESAIRSGRQVARLASTAIRGMHRGEGVSKEMAALERELAKLRRILRGHPEFWHGGIVEGALQEAAEASIVEAVLKERPLPAPEVLRLPAAAYVLGLGDAIGELRRLALDRLRLGELDQATRFVDAMDDMYHAILGFDYPDAIVAVRHKQDVARSLLERTRGELAVATRSAELELKLARVARGR